jgi:hypothetical protein
MGNGISIYLVTNFFRDSKPAASTRLPTNQQVVTALTNRYVRASLNATQMSVWIAPIFLLPIFCCQLQQYYLKQATKIHPSRE